jgi:hypothetical protein
VSNAGIGGNELLRNRVPELFGVSAAARLPRDVLAQAGARSVRASCERTSSAVRVVSRGWSQVWFSTRCPSRASNPANCGFAATRTPTSKNVAGTRSSRRVSSVCVR